MSRVSMLALGSTAFLVCVSLLHGLLNLGWDAPRSRPELTVGHLPVTCHLTCPITSWATGHSASGTDFLSKRYTNFPAMVEDVQAGNLDAAFILAPLAMVLAREGSKPVKIVHLGHRDGTALVVRTDSPFRTFEDLKGKRIAIPHRYSNQRILIERLMDGAGMREGDVTLIDFPPPEMPTALKAGLFEAYIVGEPHAAKAELDGFGRVLYLTKDIWPHFISCVLVVTQDLIETRPELVQELVGSIAASGKWIDEGPSDRLMEGIFVEGESELPTRLVGLEDSRSRERILVLEQDAGRSPRVQAARIGGLFYGQPSELLEYVLSKPPDRVTYTDLSLRREDFEEIQSYAERLGFFAKRPVTAADPFDFEDYCDDRFEQTITKSVPLRGDPDHASR